MQQNVFLESEADQWFLRNKSALESKSKNTDPLYTHIISLVEKGFEAEGKSILEIGCANGYRLSWLKELGFKVKGVEPSKLAAEHAVSSNLLVESEIEVADAHDFFLSNKAQFDIILFGHSLYLVEPTDYPSIISGTMNSLKVNGYIGIYDFESNPHRRKYHHTEGVYSYKMKFSDIFTWHPQYHLVCKYLEEHGSGLSKGNYEEDCSLTLIRKISLENAFPTLG